MPILHSFCTTSDNSTGIKHQTNRLYFLAKNGKESYITLQLCAGQDFVASDDYWLVG